jgi:sec-independent protein translocase protein TatA
MPRIGLQELLVLLAIVLLLFGATRLPQLGRGLGESLRNFRKGLKGDDEGARLDEPRDAPPGAPPPPRG